MGNQLSSDILSDQTGQVGGDSLHSILQVLLHFSSVINHLESLITEFNERLDIKIADFLSHGVETAVNNLFRKFSIFNNLFYFLSSERSSISIANKFNTLNIFNIIGHNSGQFGVMPWIPLSDSHSECVDVLVQEVKQVDRLDDRLILSVHIIRDLGTGESVAQTQTRLHQVDVFEL